MNLEQQYNETKLKWTGIWKTGTFEIECGFCREHKFGCPRDDRCELFKRIDHHCLRIIIDGINLRDVHISAAIEDKSEFEKYVFIGNDVSVGKYVPKAKRKAWAKKFLKHLAELFPEFEKEKK